MEVDKAQEGVDAKPNELNKPKKRKKPKSKWITKNKLLLANREDIASADQEMIVQAPTDTGDTVLIQDDMGEKVGKFTQLMATFIGGFVIAFVKGWLLTLVMLSLIPLLVIAITPRVF
ncbi:ABC transporter B family member 21-like protein, partial [Tanacetum coccineum]